MNKYNNKLGVVIIGSGGHVKVLVDALLLSGRNVLGCTSQKNDETDKAILGVPILGGDEIIHDFGPSNWCLVNGIGRGGMDNHRRTVYDAFSNLGYRFETIVHPSATLASSVEIGSGAQLLAGVIVQPGVKIGDNTIINTGAQIDHDTVIGEHVHVAPGAVLSGDIRVGDGAFIGAGVTIIQGLTIGDNAMVGAGATVVKNVPAGTMVVGTPARRIN